MSSNLKTDEGFEEFMRWGNKFASDSQRNSPLSSKKDLKDNLSFTFTKRDDKSPRKEISKIFTEDSKSDQLEIQECSPSELPSVNIPKRSAVSGAGEIFEKHILDKMNFKGKAKSSRNNSSGIPESVSHKTIISTKPHHKKIEQKRSPVLKNKKPYSYKSGFQCGQEVSKRSRNPSKTGSYFTTGNKAKQTHQEKMSGLSRTNESKLSKGSDGFREAQMFTFAKQTPKSKKTPKPKDTLLHTPNTQKVNSRNEKSKSNMSGSSKKWTSNTKPSYKAQSSDKKNTALTRQIASQASKKLSYLKPTDSFHSKRNANSSKNTKIVTNIKHSASLVKKNIIQSMLTSKLSTSNNMRVKVRQKPPSVRSNLSVQKLRPQTNSSKAYRTKYTANYIPKYRKSATKEKLLLNNQKNHRIVEEEISINESDDEELKIKEYSNISEIMKGKKHPRDMKLNSSEIQRLLKINLDLIQTFSQGIEASKSIVTALANHEMKDSDEITSQIERMEKLNKKIISFSPLEFYNSTNATKTKNHKYMTELSGIVNRSKKRKPIR